MYGNINCLILLPEVMLNHNIINNDLRNFVRKSKMPTADNLQFDVSMTTRTVVTTKQSVIIQTDVSILT